LSFAHSSSRVVLHISPEFFNPLQYSEVSWLNASVQHTSEQMKKQCHVMIGKAEKSIMMDTVLLSQLLSNIAQYMLFLQIASTPL
jgi:hypothetical protein